MSLCLGRTQKPNRATLTCCDGCRGGQDVAYAGDQGGVIDLRGLTQKPATHRYLGQWAKGVREELGVQGKAWGGFLGLYEWTLSVTECWVPQDLRSELGPQTEALLQDTSDCVTGAMATPFSSCLVPTSLNRASPGSTHIPGQSHGTCHSQPNVMIP